jgi:hypothetical protein
MNARSLPTKRNYSILINVLVILYDLFYDG